MSLQFLQSGSNPTRRRPDTAAGATGSNPFAIGTSPFHVKGGVYAGTRAYFDSEVKGGFGALLEELGPGPLRDFIDQRFLPVGWYDVMAVPPLVEAEARVAGQSLKVYLRHRSAFQARQDISGIYRVLLKLISPDSVAHRLPRLTSQIFDFGKTETVELTPGTVKGSFTGYPAALWEWYSMAFNVYAETALKLAGAQTVDVQVPAPTPEAPQGGVPMISFSIAASWTR